MVFDRICELLSEQLGVDAADITADSQLVADLGADSLDVVELVTTLEDEYNIVILDDDLRESLTVGEIVAYIESKI